MTNSSRCNNNFDKKKEKECWLLQKKDIEERWSKNTQLNENNNA
jgi:hypothetical protein